MCQLYFIEEIWLFGSRARNDHQDRSDIDLFIIAPNATTRDIRRVEEIIEKADTLLKIDLTWDKTVTNLEFKQQIYKYHTILYKKELAALEILKLKYEDLEKSLKRFHEVIQEDKSTIIRDATIQRFEFTFELFWKVLKKILSHEGEETTTPRDTITKAYQYKLINNEEIWINMMNDRNKTSHMYDEKVADNIYNNMDQYYTELHDAFLYLKKYMSPIKINKKVQRK